MPLAIVETPRTSHLLARHIEHEEQLSDDVVVPESHRVSMFKMPHALEPSVARSKGPLAYVQVYRTALEA